METTNTVETSSKSIEVKPANPQEVTQTDVKKTVLEDHGYKVGRQIGSGSYAKVKIAFSQEHNTLVAIKIISKFKAPSDYLRKFLPRETDVVKGLHHVNLIHFYQSIETTHRVYIVMQYAEKGSLLDLIRRDNYLDEARSKKFYNMLINVIEYCHNHGVVHRDIKCENLLLDKNYNIKLIDFGFARNNMKINTSKPILSETYCGSYAYASPEILKGVPYEPQHSDIWASGVVLFAMVFGRLPFDDSNYPHLLKLVQSKVIFPREPRVSTNAKNLIQKILSPLRVRLHINDIRQDTWMLPTPITSALQVIPPTVTPT